MLQDKAIIVAGGTGQIGAVAAVRLAEQGAWVIVPFRRREAADQLKLRAGKLANQMLLLQMEEGSLEAAQEVVEAGRQAFGRIDGLADLIGTYADGRVEETDPQMWHEQMQVNLHQAFYWARAVLPMMHQQNYGRLVFTASISALSRGPGGAAYVVSKSALIALAQVIAKEHRRHNILVHVLAPGTVNTEANRRSITGDPATWVQPDELANHVSYFLSDQVQHSTGNVIEIPSFE